MGITFKRNGWHYRLQKFVIGNSAEQRMNLCPYFWITVFCLMASPFVAVGAVIFIILDTVFSWLLAGLDAVICKPMDLFFASKATDEFLKTMWLYSDERWEERRKNSTIPFVRSYDSANTSKQVKWGNKFTLWIKAQEKEGKSWRHELKKRFKQMEARKKEFREKERKSEQQRYALHQERKAKIDKVMMVVAKYTFIPLMAVVGVSLVLFVGWLIWRAYVLFNWVMIGKAILAFLYWLVIVLACAGVVGFLVTLIVHLVKKCDIHFSFGWMRPLGVPFVAIGRWSAPPFLKVGGWIDTCFAGIGSFFSFFWEYAMAWKEDHCPSITWED